MGSDVGGRKRIVVADIEYETFWEISNNVGIIGPFGILLSGNLQNKKEEASSSWNVTLFEKKYGIVSWIGRIFNFVTEKNGFSNFCTTKKV